MNASVIFAILKRNLVSYFSSPIGYVFICALVLLTAFAAFWPADFFNANLANLDQLNRQIPWIMLIFIPAVTMSIWAQERAQGTDELLLTLPARDLDIVVGKYLAALAIFTIALGFSVSNIIVLVGLGNPDVGLLAANYLGYFFVGAAMISIGMVASFLTANLTIGFVLGATLNAPLVFAAHADAIVPIESMARFVQGLSIAEQFRDFSRGLVTLSSVAYFTSIIAVSLYLSMVLISQRHWKGRAAAVPMGLHFSLRSISLVAVMIGINVVVIGRDARADVTREQLSSLSRHTVELLRGLSEDRPVSIEAYISPEVPQDYIQTRLDLLTMLREVNVLGGDAVAVTVHETRRFSEEAAEAGELFDITPRQVQRRTGGKFSVEQIFLGVAFLSGLDKVVVPFFDRGLPVEYELVRSIATVCQQQRKRIGVVVTDARLFGGFDMQTMQSRPDEQIITELEKQYELVRVSPAQPITETFDALLVVQPSSLPQPQLDNLIEAVGRGQPTAIFEDPFPYVPGGPPPTSEPRRPQGGNPMMQQQPPEPKGNIRGLWSLLQIDFRARRITWDSYNPYPQFPFEREFVFVADGSGSPEAFSTTSPITSGLQRMLLVFAGQVAQQEAATLTFTPLLKAGVKTGTVDFGQLVERTMFGARLNPNRLQVPTNVPYTLAARIQGTLRVQPAPDGGEETARTQPEAGSIDAVVVADMDLLQSVFFAMRAQGNDENTTGIDVDNVTFVLNTLDALAGDDRFIEIRKRRPAHRTLTAVEIRTEEARKQADDRTKSFSDDFDVARAAEEKALRDRIASIQGREGIDPQQLLIEVATAQRVGNQRFEATVGRLERDRDRSVEKIQRELALEIRGQENRYKLMAVTLPPIPPLILAVIVFFYRRNLENVGVTGGRLTR